MKKIHVLYALAAMTMMSCADDKYEVFTTANPNQGEEYEYLNSYDHLKTYVDRAKYPNFKLAGAVPASEFNQKQLVYALAVSNFDEVVTGNAFKYASVVDDKGVMNFSTVKDFTDNAVGAGLLPYGHTLVWHSQQNIKYLTSLMADKELDVDPDDNIPTNVFTTDFSDGVSLGGWGNDHTRTVENGVMIINNPKQANPWEAQVNCETGYVYENGKEYFLKMRIKGSAEGSISAALQNPDNYAGCGDFEPINFTTDWKDVTVRTICNGDNAKRLLLNIGAFAGEIYIDDYTVYYKSAPAITIPVNMVEYTFDDGKLPGGNGADKFSIVDGGPDGSKCMLIDNPSAAANPWDVQPQLIAGYAPDVAYKISMKVKGSVAGSFGLSYESPGWSGAGNVNVTTDWKEVNLSITPTDARSNINLNVGQYAGQLWIDDLKVYYEKSANSIPLTPEEKKEALTQAMDNWIKGMMNATEGRVKAWDLVNEPIGGAGDDGQGNYALQHADNPDDNGVKGDNFYWQDILGDIDFVVLAEKKARKYFEEAGGNPEELKLFINDYNLESWWDGNKKVKSMVNWIKKWENAGAKIDGIGTQMHVSFMLDENDQKRQEESIENMFRILAASGKLIRVSELDMGIVPKAFGEGIKTENVTEEQHHKMAAFYKWIVQKYLEIIPVEQQWGICVWGLTDSPANSGWRAGEPIGAWDINYHRKHTYAGYADGLSGK